MLKQSDSAAFEMFEFSPPIQKATANWCLCLALKQLSLQTLISLNRFSDILGQLEESFAAYPFSTFPVHLGLGEVKSPRRKSTLL